jgi:hypothetical protein
MAPLFTPAADTALRAVFATVLGVPVLGVGLLLVATRTPLGTGAFTPLQQPVQFDHRHHTDDEGITCNYCHGLAWSSPRAGVPPTSVCMGCHAQIWNESLRLEPVRASYFEDAAIPWQRVHRLPDFTFFNHAIHVHKGVGCVTCHGRVDTMALVYQAQPLTMGWCVECHRNPAPHLRPLSEITNMTWQPPENAKALGQRLKEEYDVNPRTTCNTCHR